MKFDFFVFVLMIWIVSTCVKYSLLSLFKFQEFYSTFVIWSVHEHENTITSYTRPVCTMANAKMTCTNQHYRTKYDKDLLLLFFVASLGTISRYSSYSSVVNFWKFLRSYRNSISIIKLCQALKRCFQGTEQ